MRNEPNLRVEQYRETHPIWGRSPNGTNWGYFVVRRVGGDIAIISSGTDEDHGWEHVSVSLAKRTPTWDEMCMVKKLFWRDDETVIQFHPPEKVYVNQCANCLHLWRKIGDDFPLPPLACV